MIRDGSIIVGGWKSHRGRGKKGLGSRGGSMGGRVTDITFV